MSDLAVKPMNNLTPKLPAIWRRYSQDEFKQCIEDNCGVVTLVCNILDCTYTQFYAAIKKWNLQEFMLEQKKNLVARAEEVLLKRLASENESISLKAAELTLKSRFAQESGWGNSPNVEIKQQINVADKAAALSAIFGL